MTPRGFGSEPDSAPDGDGEALEPAPAGVSSLAGAAAGRAAASANGNGKSIRAVARPDQSSAAGPSAGEDLEDLPF